ncbi:5308_t:CDS:2, partial [Funneliformis mosseae]
KNQMLAVVIAQLQNIPKCNAEFVCDTVIKNIKQDNLDFTRCILWITDNTAYISEIKGDPISQLYQDDQLITLPPGR